MKKILFIFAFFLAANFTAFSQTSASKTEKIKKFLEISGSSKMAMQALDQMVSTFKTQSTSVSNSFWDDFMKEVNPNDLINMIIPIYEKYYSEEDLDGLIAFYQTDLGKKVLASTPIIMQESLQAGQVWGKELGEKIVKKMQEDKAKN